MVYKRAHKHMHAFVYVCVSNTGALCGGRLWINMHAFIVTGVLVCLCVCVCHFPQVALQSLIWIKNIFIIEQYDVVLDEYEK